MPAITMPTSCPIVRARSKIMHIGAEFLIALAHNSVFQHTESAFSSDTRQSMERRMIAKQLIVP